MSPLIVPKCERKKRRGDDKELSQARRLTANAFFAPEAVVWDSPPIYKAYDFISRSRSYQASCFMAPIS